MGTPHKFLFDRSFDQPDSPRALSNRPPPDDAAFTRAELDAARAAGMAEGRKAAVAEMARSREERAAAALTTLAAGLEEMLGAREQCASELKRRAIETVRAIARKAVPALCRKDPLAEVDALVADCLNEAFDEPRLVLRVAEALFETVRERLDTLTASAGFAGKVVLLADETLGPSDARIEWAEGGAERATARLLDDIDGALARALDAIPTPPAKPVSGEQHE